jgi:hypothetical protein
MKAESIKYLEDNIYLWEARKQGVCKHLSESQAKNLLSIAKEIKQGIEFQIRDCQSCHDAMVLFVYKHYEARMKRKAKAVKEEDHQAVTPNRIWMEKELNEIALQNELKLKVKL